MSYVTVKDLMADAERNEYAVGGFNLNNMEILQAVIQAAEEEDHLLYSKPSGRDKVCGYLLHSRDGKAACRKGLQFLRH